MRRLTFALAAAAFAVVTGVAVADVRVSIENISSDAGVTTPLAPGVWALVESGTPNPLFTAYAADAGNGLEALAEDGNPSMLAASMEGMAGVIAYGVFNTPDGADGPGPLFPGGSYSFTVDPKPGSRLYFATMFVQSNDWFFAPGRGLDLAGDDGMAMKGDMTGKVELWDAGTEADEEIGTGANQAPRQSGPDTGADEMGVVYVIVTGGMYPPPSEMIRVSIGDAMM